MTHYQLERNYGCRVSDAWTFRGLKTAVIENELLRVVVLIDKGADIYQFVHKPTDTDFLWRSPWGVRDPSVRIPTTGSGEGWMDGRVRRRLADRSAGRRLPDSVHGRGHGPARRGQHRALGRRDRGRHAGSGLDALLGTRGAHAVLLREDADAALRLGRAGDRGAPHERGRGAGALRMGRAHRAGRTVPQRGLRDRPSGKGRSSTKRETTGTRTTSSRAATGGRGRCRSSRTERRET